MRLRLTALVLAITPAAVLAHEGHGVAGEGHTVEHYVTEPLHVAGFAVLVVATVAAVALIRKRRVARQAVRTQR